MICPRAQAVALAASHALAGVHGRVAADPTGGINFWCALFQTVKIVSLVTGQLEGVVVGAIGGGIACGFGW